MGVTLPGHILLCFLCFLQIGSQGELELYRKASTVTWTNQRASSLGNVRWQTRFLIVSVHCYHLRTSLTCALLLSCVDIICCCVLGAPTCFTACVYPTLLDWLAHCHTCTTWMADMYVLAVAVNPIYSTYIVFGCTRWKASYTVLLPPCFGVSTVQGVLQGVRLSLNTHTLCRR